MGTPKIPRFLGKLIGKGSLSPSKQSKTDIKNIKSAHALVLLTSSGKDKISWIETGRQFQYFSLKATSRGISIAHHNQAIQVSETAGKLRKTLDINDYPALLVRIGYAESAPDSNRRDVKEMIA